MSSVNHNQGFTLLEILVAASIFAIVITAASGIFVSAIRSQGKVLGKQMAISNTSYALEYMSRAIRMAKKDQSGDCLSNADCNYSNRGGNLEAIRFLNHNEKCIEFLLEQGRIRRKKSDDQTNSFDANQPFTPQQELEIKRLEFKLNGECQSDQQQPTVTILVWAETEQGLVLKTQTTVAQRNLDLR